MGLGVSKIGEKGTNRRDDKAIGGDRTTMELWFDRAMKADGDRRDACWSKLHWLDPMWHGTPEDLLAFGRRCRDT
jgi:hypothetical protein